MRKSFMQVMKRSRMNSVDHETTSNTDTSFDGIHRNKFAHRLTQLARVASEHILQPMSQHKFLSTKVITNKQVKEADTHKIPEYQFLKNKDEVQSDPFLKAKMKYLIKKQKPNLISNINRHKLYESEQRNNENKLVEEKSFTTLKKESRIQENRKVLLLHFANSQNVEKRKR